jgi:hypothetical protein
LDNRSSSLRSSCPPKAIVSPTFNVMCIHCVGTKITSPASCKHMNGRYGCKGGGLSAFCSSVQTSSLSMGGVGYCSVCG